MRELWYAAGTVVAILGLALVSQAYGAAGYLFWVALLLAVFAGFRALVGR